VKVVTYNAAGIRARLLHLVDWLAHHEPDVVAIQETKVEDDKFPRELFEELGYEIAIHGQKSWNGVAMLSRMPITNVRPGFGDELMPNDARILSCTINGVQFINTYVPNGNTVGSEKWEYKLRWLDRFRTYLDQNFSPQEPLIWFGDINIAPTPIDVFDSKKMYGGVGHHPDEFSRLATIVDFGLIDLFRKFTPEGEHYTYWDFTIPRGVARNLGWRIDHIYGTEVISNLCRDCTIDRDARSYEKPSDHTYVIADIDI